MNDIRVAWLFPSLGRGQTGFTWHPLLKEFTHLFPQTTIYTGRFPGFAPDFEDTFTVKIIGKTFKIGGDAKKYKRGLIYLSPNIIAPLLQFKPQVIFATAFSLWTLIVTLLKPLCGWRIIVLYEGSSPTTDSRNAKFRSFVRRLIVKAADAFLTNTKAGKQYLTEILSADENRVFVHPYEVPVPELVLRNTQAEALKNRQLQHPVFLYLGQIIERKGIHLLLQACTILHQQGCREYTLLIIGDGPQREELEALCRQYELQDCVQWLGWVEYKSLGVYFQNIDVFVFPTLEDTWGMVVLEAMAFGKPILTSKFAGASEMVTDDENGYLFDPHQPEELAKLMRRFIDNHNLIKMMGEKSQQMIAPHTPEKVSKFLAEVVEFVTKKTPINSNQ